MRMSRNTFDLKMRSSTLIVVLFLYKTVIELIYIFRISPLYDYYGLQLNMNFISFAISSIYLIIIIILMPKDKKMPSSFLYLIFTIFLTIPTISYYWLNDQSHVYTFFLVLSCIIISLILRLKRISIGNNLKSPRQILGIIFIFYIFISIYLIFKRGGVDLRALNFMTIYKMRSEASLPKVLGYIVNWCAKAFSPFYFGYFYYNNNKKGILLVAILQLLLYLSFGVKAFLFSLGLLILCICASKRNKFEITFTNSFTWLILTSIIIDILGITGSLRNTIPFRMVFVPSQIQYQYFEFFKNRDKMLFADGIIGKLLSIESPFNMPVPYVISNYFYHDGGASSSNTGIFADAYANGGFLMMLFFAVLLGLIFYIIDSISSKIPPYITVAAFSYIMFVFNDNSLLTALLTGGIWLVMILLLLFNAEIRTEISENDKLLENSNMKFQ